MPKKTTRTRRRWVCPECEVGILAPQGMAALNPKRFCLDCSSEKGRRKMVERVCLATETRKAKKKVSATKKKAKKKAKKRAKELGEFLFDGVHMKTELRRLARLVAFKGAFKGKWLPDLRLEDRGKFGDDTFSTFWWYGPSSKRANLLIVIKHNVNADAPSVKAAMLNALVHCYEWKHGRDDENLTVDRIGRIAKAGYKLDEHNIAGATSPGAARDLIAEGLRAG
jgi:hypothetical protein